MPDYVRVVVSVVADDRTTLLNDYKRSDLRCVSWDTVLLLNTPIDPGCTSQITPGYPLLQPGLNPS